MHEAWRYHGATNSNSAVVVYYNNSTIILMLSNARDSAAAKCVLRLLDANTNLGLRRRRAPYPTAENTANPRVASLL